MAGTIARVLVVAFGFSYGLGIIRELLLRRRRDRRVHQSKRATSG